MASKGVSLAGSEYSLHPLPTVLMCVRAWREGSVREAVLLQLSVGPEGPGDFQLCVRRNDGLRGLVLADFKLKDISYELKTSRCHQLFILGTPGSTVDFTFDDEPEAQKWWTVVSSSLRETRKVAQIQGNGRTKPVVAEKPEAGATKNPFKSLSVGTDASVFDTDMCTKEDLAIHLSRSIENGDQQMAAHFASALAKLKVPLQIQLKQTCYPKNEICMKVGLEDASGSVNISVIVQVHTTIAMLKQQIFRDYEFHPSIQRWIIGQCLCSDDRTVGSYGIKRDGDSSFLYLLSAKQAKLNQQDQHHSLLPPPHIPGPSWNNKPRSSTLPNRTPPKNVVKRRQNVDERVNIVDVARNLHLEIQALNMSPQIPAAPPSPAQPGWSCSVCTFINKPTRPGCEMCSADRPADYVVPNEYTPDEVERRRLQQERDSLQQYNKGKGRREDEYASHQDQNCNSQDDFIHLSAEFC